MVEVMDPKPGDTICDPGFLLVAHEHILKHNPSWTPTSGSISVTTR